MAELTKNKYLEKMNKNISSIESITKPLNKSIEKKKKSKSKTKSADIEDKINSGWKKVITKTDELFSDVEVTEDSESSVSEKLDRISDQIDRTEARTLAMSTYITGVSSNSPTLSSSDASSSTSSKGGSKGGIGSKESEDTLSKILSALGLHLGTGTGFKLGVASASLIKSIVTGLGSLAVANPMATAAVVAAAVALGVGKQYVDNAAEDAAKTDDAYDTLVKENGTEIDASVHGASNTESIIKTKEGMQNDLATLGKSGMQKTLWKLFSKKDDLGPNILDPKDLGLLNIDLDKTFATALQVPGGGYSDVERAISGKLDLLKDEFNYSDPLDSISILCAMYLSRNSTTKLDKDKVGDLIEDCVGIFLNPLGGIQTKAVVPRETAFYDVIALYLPMMMNGEGCSESEFFELFYEVVTMSELDKYLTGFSQKRGFFGDAWGATKTTFKNVWGSITGNQSTGDQSSEDQSTRICLFRSSVIVGTKNYPLALNPDSLYYHLNQMAIVNRAAGRSGFGSFKDNMDSFRELRTDTKKAIQGYISAKEDLQSATVGDIQDMLTNGDLSEDALLKLASENSGLGTENETVNQLVKSMYSDFKAGDRNFQYYSTMGSEELSQVIKDKYKIPHDEVINMTDLMKVVDDFGTVDRLATNTKAFLDEGVYDPDILAMKYSPWDISNDEDASDAVKFGGRTIQEIYDSKEGSPEMRYKETEKEILEFMRNQAEQGFDTSLPIMDMNNNVYFNKSTLVKTQANEAQGRIEESLETILARLKYLEETSNLSLGNTTEIAAALAEGMSVMGGGKKQSTTVAAY